MENIQLYQKQISNTKHRLCTVRTNIYVKHKQITDNNVIRIQDSNKED